VVCLTAATEVEGPGGGGAAAAGQHEVGVSVAAAPAGAPAAWGWGEDQRWALARVTTLIGRLFDVRYTLRGTSCLLHRIGFTPQVPAHRAVERDEDAAVAVILSLVKGLTPLSGRKVGV
jgi:transposase